jgi:hypothetical protein
MYYTRIHPSPTYDISWQALGSWVATAVETNVAIICGSVPALNGYFKGWFGVTGYEERGFGWYNRPRWSPWTSARQCSSRSAPPGFTSWNRGPAVVTDAVTVPCRTCEPALGSASKDMMPGWHSRSIDSEGTIGRQDSHVPILQCRIR